VWRPEWEVHANGAERVTEIIVVHPSPADLQPIYVKLYGESAVRGDENCLVVKLGEDKISFLAPRAFQRRCPTIAVPVDLSQGWFAGAALRVRSLDEVAGILAAAGIAAVQTLSGSLVVAPSEAANTLIEFEAA
jgi:hypothetical protein